MILRALESAGHHLADLLASPLGSWGLGLIAQWLAG
jgi:hypothetical protein